MNYEEKLGEITACKSLLDDTDYTIIKSLESLFACENTIDFIQKLKDTSAAIKETIQSRTKWREIINKLEVEVATEEEEMRQRGEN